MLSEEIGHPNFNEEAERLEFTKKYIDIVIQASESDEASFKENLREQLEGMELNDSSLSYMSMLTNANLLRRTIDEVKKLKKFANKPYFARIDFLRNETNQEERLYIGKLSLFDKETQQPIVVDWRSPVANLYYDGRLGDVSYEAEGEQYDGFLSLKRQYIIEDGDLKEIRDIDLTTNDELLQLSLSESSNNRLSEIVATIQEEQNEIIRADLNRPIIVQGAAGSGKTTIALHRLSYFIYTYAEHFRPEQLMILAPNRLFIDYISEVLPELGVENILQTTFIDYVKACIKKNIKMTHPEDKLISFIHHELENPERAKMISEFKGSLQFRDILDNYLQDILKTLLPKEDFYVAHFKLYSAKKLRYLMVHEYKYLPYYQRIDKIKRVLQNHVRFKKKAMIEKITSFYDQKLDKGLAHKGDPEKRKQYISKVLDKKQEGLAQIQKQLRTAVTSYIKQLPKHDVFYYYHQLVTNEALFTRYAKGVIKDEDIHFFCQYQQHLYEKKTYELEDLAALLYMQGKIFGIDKELRVKNVVIDEAQDYSYFQLEALKTVLETDMFTIVGDLAQGIHSYRGIKDWHIVQEQIFTRASFKTLQKSYRTTIEIMQLANEVQQLLNMNLPVVEPVVRHSPKPSFFTTETKRNDVQTISKMIAAFYKEGMKTVAVIGKTNKECKKIVKLFQQYSDIHVQQLKENEEINSDNVVVVSSHLAKGLEFDAVILYAIDEVYQMEELDIKLLYVSMTRPLHRLVLFGPNLSAFLLDKIDPQYIHITQS
ncbi:RNA polymerase recycling motor HelD [Heyndrickxia ginsengihumi]|uniref:RNA polymerase recycling motor HelD n=2 Tax=Heyndrickxia ginsengihumi TaxID=363870 RepID=UPI0004711EE8|nr:RNA polymerase recycling motor HelD [Heyndrickxia ginsengihumi]